MKKFKQIAEKIIDGGLVGEFILRNGERYEANNETVVRNLSEMLSEQFPFYIDKLGSYTADGHVFLYSMSEMDIVGFDEHTKIDELVDDIEYWLRENFAVRHDEYGRPDGVCCGFVSLEDMFNDFDKKFRNKELVYDEKRR